MMKAQQRGIASGWLYLIGLIALIGALAGLLTAWKSYTNGLVEQGRAAGIVETKAQYAQRDNEALQEKVARIEQLEKAARAGEAKHAKEVAVIAAKREKERQSYEDQRKRDAVAIAAGELRLRDPGAVACAAEVGDRSAGAEVGSTASGRDGRAGGELSREATAFLFDLINEADDITRQLTDAQAVILQDRVTCGQ